jgi:hypothetical protein
MLLGATASIRMTRNLPGRPGARVARRRAMEEFRRAAGAAAETLLARGAAFSRDDAVRLAIREIDRHTIGRDR